MGYIRHHAIVVTGLREEVERAHKQASMIFPQVSPIAPGLANHPLYHSFFVPPDGSKEGWKVSEIGDDCRQKFRDWLMRCRDLAWVEVQFGDDGGDCRIIDAGDFHEL